MSKRTTDLKTNFLIAGNSVEAPSGGLESGRARGVTLRGKRFFLSAIVVLSGCTAAYAPAPLPINHPANPAAAEAPPPSPSLVFSQESALPGGHR